jgi:hypothetical protein
MSISHQGKVIAQRINFGFVPDYQDPPTYTARRLPNESLIITRNDRETEVVFAFDTATGESCPFQGCQKYELYKQRCDHWETRIHTALGDTRYQIRSSWHQR